MYFAWTYPFSFVESLLKTQKWIKKFKRQDSMYIHREVICLSREKRPIEMITLTKQTKMTDKREPLIEGLFPED